MDPKPVFRRDRDRNLLTNYTVEANRVRSQKSHTARADCIVRKHAIAKLRRGKVYASDEVNVLGQYTMEFGEFHNQTFKWIMENAASYAAYIVSSMTINKETMNTSDISHNKHRLQVY